MAHGAIIFIEIPVRDLQRAADFYAGTFGWSFEPTSTSSWMFNPGGRGAMGSITTDRRPIDEGPRLHIAVDDIDEALARTRMFGGRVERGREVWTATLGDWAVIRDPDGTYLGIFESRLGARRQADQDGSSESG